MNIGNFGFPPGRVQAGAVEGYLARKWKASSIVPGTVYSNSSIWPVGISATVYANSNVTGYYNGALFAISPEGVTTTLDIFNDSVPTALMTRTLTGEIPAGWGYYFTTNLPLYYSAELS